MAEANKTDPVGRLEDISPHLAERIRRLERIVEDPLSRIYSIFPAYTDHGKSHSKQVMTVLNWLLPADMASPLSEQEMFYLLAAAILHDIGMLEAVDKVGDLDAQKKIRDAHHLRSERYVRENYERLGLDKPEADAVSEICRSHRKINIIEDVHDVPSPSGTLIRMQLLCAAIRIADELHLTADRAPQIVLDAIRPSQDSVSHFEKHLSIDGVGPHNASEGVILISATVQTSSQERALQQMKDEIQEKLTEVAPIFAQHDLPWNTVELTLQRRNVVERKVTLYLARSGESHKDELAAKLDESQGAIETCLQDITLFHYIQLGEKVDHVRLVADNYTFEHLLRQFLKTEEEFEFVTSPYLHRCIEEFAFGNFCQRFGAVYNPQEREDRILALRTSPTALYLLLFASEFQIDQAIISRRVVLDAAILFGFLRDLFRFPKIAQIRGIVPAIRAIQGKARQESGSNLKLLQALGPDSGRDYEDVIRDLIAPPELQSIDSQDRVDFQLTVSHPSNAIERGLTFPHLLKASSISGEKVELVPGRVRLSSKDPRVQDSAESLSYFVITPHPLPLPSISGVMFCRVEIDHSRKRITLFADLERSTDYSKYPIIIRLASSQERRSVNFTPSIYIPNIDVQQALEIDTMFQWMKSGDFERFVMQMDQPKPLQPEDTPPNLEVLGSDLKDETVELLFDESRRQVLRCLVQLQDRINERISCPLGLTAQQEEAIIKLARASDEMEVPQVRDELSSIAEQFKSDRSTVRISTYFSDGKIESDQFLGPFPRIIPKVEFKQQEKTQKVTEWIQRGSVAVAITQNFVFDVATLTRKIAEGFSEDKEISFLPQETESGLAANTACQVTFQFIQDKKWYREQVIHYQIRDISGTSKLCSTANLLLKQNQVESAINLLIESRKKFPNDAFLTGLLGWAYYRAGDLDSAYKYSAEAVNLQQGTWLVRADFAYYNLGLCCLLMNKFEESVSWYKEAITSGPGQTLDEAIEDLEAVITSEIPEILYALAFLCEHKGSLPKAIELYRQFLDSNSKYDEYKNLAQAAIKRIENGK